MSYCGFAILWRKEQAIQRQHSSFPEKDKDGMMVTDKCKRQADVILLIATHVIW